MEQDPASALRNPSVSLHPIVARRVEAPVFLFRGFAFSYFAKPGALAPSHPHHQQEPCQPPCQSIPTGKDFPPASQSMYRKSCERAKFTEGQRPASIPAWGNAPGTRAIGDRGLKARSILDRARRMGRAFSPLAFSIHDPLGRRPRLVWVAPLAHRQAGLSLHPLRNELSPSGN